MAIKFDGVNAPYGADDTLPWLPFEPQSGLVAVKAYSADTTSGEVVLLLRAPPGSQLSPHRSTGATTIYTLQGRWKYREHVWVAGRGSPTRTRRGISSDGR